MTYSINGHKLTPSRRRSKKAFALSFWRRVKKSKPDQCWPWQGATTNRLYGTVCWNYRMRLAHRIAYFLAKGKIPKRKQVRHTCDNPPCCNPRHLVLGSSQQNMDDVAERGRANRPMFGKKETMLAMYETGDYTQTQLAQLFGVHQSHISRLIRGER